VITRMKLNLRSNAFWGVAEVIVGAACLFILYRLVVLHLGVGALGLWSIVMAMTSLVRIADPASVVGLGRFIALAHGRGEIQKMGDYFITALLSSLALYALLCALAFWPLWKALSFSVAATDLERARDLLPYAIASFLLINFVGIVQGTLAGMQRSDQKSKLAIFCLILQLVLALVLIPVHGLSGVAEAQIAQYCVGATIGYFLVLREMLGRLCIWPPFRWRLSALREIWAFGIKLQALSIVSSLYEPLSKSAISSIAGIEALGVYEMAQKVTAQARQLALGPATVLMPAFAQISVQAPGNLEQFYRQSLTIIFALGGAIMTGVALSSPLISFLWIGRIEPWFVIFACAMCVCWFANIAGAPSSSLAVARGYLRWNFWGAMVTAATAPLLAALVGQQFTPPAAGLGAILALGLGSLLSLVMNCRAAKLPAWVTVEDLHALGKFIVSRQWGKGRRLALGHADLD